MSSGGGVRRHADVMVCVDLTLSGRRALKTLLAANKRLNTVYLLKESFGHGSERDRPSVNHARFSRRLLNVSGRARAGIRALSPLFSPTHFHEDPL